MDDWGMDLPHTSATTTYTEYPTSPTRSTGMIRAVHMLTACSLTGILRCGQEISNRQPRSRCSPWILLAVHLPSRQFKLDQHASYRIFHVMI